MVPVPSVTVSITMIAHKGSLSSTTYKLVPLVILSLNSCRISREDNITKSYNACYQRDVVLVSAQSKESISMESEVSPLTLTRPTVYKLHPRSTISLVVA